MTSAKKYGIQEFATKLPDFLLQFVDANIRNDPYGALRVQHLSHKIDDLIPQQLIPENVIWLYCDPVGSNHIIILAEKFNQLSKASESLPRKDKQLTNTTNQNYNILQFQPKNLLNLLVKQDQLQYISRSKIVTLDEIRLKCEANLYFSAENLLMDIKNVIAWNQIYRCSSKRSFIHLSNFYSKFLQLIVKRKIVTKFYQKKNKDFEELEKLQIQFKLSVTQWPFIPKKFRQYEQLQKYSPNPFSRTEIVQKRLKSKKVPVQCPQNCVCYRQDLKSHEQFCNYSLADVWQSQCPNRKARIQCDHQDQDKMEKCRNSQIKKKMKKKVKKTPQDDSQAYEIQQFMAWGIDLFTRNVIFNCLPEIDIKEFLIFQRNTENKNLFIENTLQRALNFIGDKGYDIVKACKFIIQNGPKLQDSKYSQKKKYQWNPNRVKKFYKNSQSDLFTSIDVQYATNLLKNKIYCDTQFPNNQTFRIHTKGKGAKCINKEGIKRGTFIVEYFGEIYEPWRWYEREDFIKQVLKKKKLKQVIPQFYNIYLQKHKDQPLGYDILVVDPIKKGNFSSRFSHSCNPNCGTISTISNGKYFIGMYSIKDIAYGQQFTFDYCSMTESNYQHTNSICLCGMKQCRGNYLQLANNKMYNNLMDNNSCFHFRNSLILKSCEPATEQQLKICHNASLKQDFLKQLPNWIVKWCCIILKSIQKEGQLYYLQLKQNWTKQYPWESKNQTEDEKAQKIQLYAEVSKNDLLNLRFQNLVTTVDKIKYYLEEIQDFQPPLFYEKNQSICKVLIENQNNDSILILLQDQCTNEKFKEQSIMIEQFLKKISLIDNQLLKRTQLTEDIVQQLYKKKLFYFRLCCLCISHLILCRGQKQNSNTILLSDIIYFYSFTHTYFAPHEYRTHTSEQIKVTLQQILGQGCNSKFSDKTRKKYTSPCIWGQMVSWFKQTIVNPQASLSQDRRGTLSYPLINSILKSNYPFEKHIRSSFLKTIRQKPASSWPPAKGCQLSYKNPYKCYGTLLFQNVHNAQKLKDLPKGSILQSVLDIINCSLSQKLKLFKQVEKTLQKIPQNDELYDILDSLKLDMQKTPPLQSIKLKENKKKKKIDNLTQQKQKIDHYQNEDNQEKQKEFQKNYAEEQ